jgi:chondroitin AC lyase
MAYRRDGLRANKSWFFLDDAVICLGAGITCEQPEPVFTALEQRRLDGPVTLSESGRVRVLDHGRLTIEAADWIHHAHIGYQLLEPAPVQVASGSRIGDWRKVHDQQRARRAEGDVFSLWIDHGAGPQQDAYAYAVYPGATTSSMQPFCASPIAKVLRHTESLQAISSRQKSVVMAVFFQRGRLPLTDAAWIEVDQPCVLMLDTSDRPWQLRLADPTQRVAAVIVRVNGHNAPRETVQELRVELPQGEHAGATVRVRLDADS